MFGGTGRIDITPSGSVWMDGMLRAHPSLGVHDRLFARALVLRDGLVDGTGLVTHTFGFDDARQVMQATIDGSQPIVKAVMLPNLR